MTLAVTHSTAADGTFSAAGAAAWNASHTLTGVADVSQGGTGASTFVANQILYGNGTGAIQSSAKLAWNDTTNVLTLGSAASTSEIQAPNGSSSAGGSFNLRAGAGAGGNFAGGDIGVLGGAGSGTGRGGNVQHLAGAGGATGSSDGGTVEIAGGDGRGSGGTVTIRSGAPTQTGNGAYTTIIATDGVGTNKNGGGVDMVFGDETGSGTKGRLSLYTNTFTYGVASGTGVLTTGLGPGTQALTMRTWIPIYVDGTLTYIQGWQV